MISNVTYISYRSKEPLMEGLGMTLTCIEETTDFNALLRNLQNSRFILAFISEDVYADHKISVDSWHEDALFLSVMSSVVEGKSLGKQRIKNLLANAVGIQKG